MLPTTQFTSGADGDFELTADGTALKMTSTAVETMRERICSRLKTFQGEWFLNESLGVPYYEEVLVKNPQVPRIRALLLSRTLAIPGVKTVTKFDVAFISAERRFTVDFHVVITNDEVVEGSI